MRDLQGLQIGQYLVKRLIGKGGMGDVYLAEHVTLQRQVALKVLRAEVAVEARATVYFHSEARVIGHFDHPNILPIYDFGEEVIQGAIVLYMVMPFCQDGSLADWLRKRNTLLSLDEIVQLLLQASEALEYIHSKGFLHRDVKSANFLLLNHDLHIPPRLVLSDFGMASILGNILNRQSIRGTPSYMAPEQWTGHAVRATDQYALAVVAYEMLTGQLPFHGGDVTQLMHSHLSIVPQPPSTLNPIISHGVDTVILRALEKEPANRFAHVIDFVHALQLAADKQQKEKNIFSLLQRTIFSRGEKRFAKPTIPRHAFVENPSTMLFPESHIPEENLLDFFISYVSSSKTDALWSEWVKWQLDNAGYSTLLPTWGIRLDSDFEIEMQKALAKAKQVLIILSPTYFQILCPQSYWIDAFKKRVINDLYELLPLYTQNFEKDAKRMLNEINYIDLTERDEQKASAILSAAVRGGSIEIPIKPLFPGDNLNKPPFPNKDILEVSSEYETIIDTDGSINSKNANTTRGLEVFLSYSHRDKRLKDMLENHLSNFIRRGLITCWHDGEIRAGSEWSKEIEKHLRQSHIILLLVSQDYIASNYYYDVEMARAMERHHKGEVCVIPIILRPTNWEGLPFSKLYVLPTGAKAITRWQNRDEAFLDVARGIQKVIDRMTKDTNLP